MLDKRYRLHKRGSFNYVYRKGESRAYAALRLTYVRGKGLPRIGISVPNTVGKAVVRNKVRRRIRAAMRGEAELLRPYQMVISARKGAEEMTYSQILEAVRELLRRADLYEKKDNGNSGN